jgi:hypothetical protein
MSHPVFTPQKQSALLEVRDRLKLLPRGWQATIATKVKRTREYVSQVLKDDDTFQKNRSDVAVRIWEEAERIDSANADKSRRMQLVLSTLKSGSPIQIKMVAPMARMIERRIVAAKIKYAVKVDRKTSPATYVFTPK